MGKPLGSHVVLGAGSSRGLGRRLLKVVAALAVTGGALVVSGTAVSGAPTTPAGNTQSQSVPTFAAPAGWTIGGTVPPTPLLTVTPAVLPSPVNTYTVTTTSDPSTGTACPATPGHPCSLRSAMNQANSDGTFDKINLPSGTYLLELGDLYANNFGGTTIAGAGAGSTTIEADSSSGDYPFSVFFVQGLLTINNATVSGGSNLGGGGADVSDGSLALNGTTFSGNNAEIGGGVFVAPGAEATLSHSTLTDNEAVYGGGLDDEGQVLASNSMVTDNIAEENGGGISLSEDVPGASFNGNNLTVSGNYAAFGGGGISSNFATFALSNSTISYNGSNSGFYTETGGGIASEGIATVNQTTIAHNTASMDGAGIANFGVLAVTGGKITNNVPPSGDHDLTGGGLVDYYKATLTNVNVLQNQADGGAGAFVQTEEPPASLTVQGGLVSDNGSFSTEGGGGIFAVEATVTVTGAAMTGDIGGDGGAIGAVEGSIVTLTNDTIGSHGDPNYAEDGGALDIYEGATAVITGSSITYSQANDAGGGIDSYEEAVVTIQNSLVADNQADYGAGADFDGTLATITGSTFAFNNALDFGGGIDNVEGASVSMTNDTVANNTVGQSITNGFGGGLDVDDGATVYINNVTVADNTAYGSGSSGGGFQVDHGAFLQSKGSLFAYNDDNGATKNNCGFGAGGFLSVGYNLSSDTSCGFSGPGDLNNVNPNLGALANNGGPTPTQAVPSTSKAVKAEANCPPPSTDQRGVKRSKPCTIGAYQK